MEQFLSLFIFDVIGIVILSILAISLLIQLFFYLRYYKTPLSFLKNAFSNDTSSIRKPSVSVVIVAKNESENLAKNLPSILCQDYPDYEVIVVNDGSTDESEILLKELKSKHPHLYSTFSPISTYENQSQRQRHKLLSLTIGIKAATKDILLFSEGDSAPMGKNWISSMVERLTPEKDIVLGYCRYMGNQKMWNNIAIYDHLLFSLQYFSMAIKNKPFTGVYRNVLYRKNRFFENKGFSSFLKYDNAEDVFLNSIMTKDNTAVCLLESAFVSCNLESFSMWKFIKTNYMRAKSHFKNYKATIFHLESFSRYLFYTSLILSLVYASLCSLWVYLSFAICLFFIRFSIQYFTLKKASEHFRCNIFLFLLPILDIAQPLYKLLFFRNSKKRVNLINKLHNSLVYFELIFIL